MDTGATSGVSDLRYSDLELMKNPNEEFTFGFSEIAGGLMSEIAMLRDREVWIGPEDDGFLVEGVTLTAPLPKFDKRKADESIIPVIGTNIIMKACLKTKLSEATLEDFI